MLHLLIESWDRNRDIDERMIGLAVDVLKSDCRSAPGLVPARRWAVSVIAHYSNDVPLQEDAREALAQNSVSPAEFNKDFSSDFASRPANPCTGTKP